MLFLKSFLENLELQAVHKAKLYDGVDRDMPIDTAIRYLIEELGEVSQEITRDRLQSALDECIDLAHCVFLLYMAIMRSKDIQGSIIHIRSDENAKTKAQ